MGCNCATKAAHEAHVKKCAKWACCCKPARAGHGGDSSHDDACMRGRYARHAIPYVNPRVGDKMQMVGVARQSGLPDLVFMAKGGWMADPDGRLIRSAWVV